MCLFVTVYTRKYRRKKEKNKNTKKKQCRLCVDPFFFFFFIVYLLHKKEMTRQVAWNLKHLRFVSLSSRNSKNGQLHFDLPPTHMQREKETSAIVRVTISIPTSNHQLYTNWCGLNNLSLSFLSFFFLEGFFSTLYLDRRLCTLLTFISALARSFFFGLIQNDYHVRTIEREVQLITQKKKKISNFHHPIKFVCVDLVAWKRGGQCRAITFDDDGIPSAANGPVTN